MPKSLKLFNFLTINITLLSFFLLFLFPAEALGQSGRVKQENKANDRVSMLSFNVKSLIRIENPFGNISINVSQNNNIQVQAIQRNSPNSASKENLVIEENSDQVYLKVLPLANSPIDLKILTPSGINLRLLSEKGNIDITFASGSLVATSKTGNINLSISNNVDADLSLSSTFGAIKISSVLKTSNSAKTDERLKSFYKQLGKGGAIVTVYTEQGNINLETNNIAQTPDITFNRITDSNLSGVKTSTIAKPNNDDRSEPILNNAPEKIAKKPILRRNDNNENNASDGEDENSSAKTTPTAKTNGINSPNNSGSSEEDGVIKIESQLVTLNASALTSSGQPVINLNQSDFLLYEDGVSQEIVHFQSANTPFNLVLLIDLSGSVKEKLKLIQRSAWSFIQATRPEDKVAIITFSGSTQLICPLTNDRQLLKKKLENIREAEGGTNFYDALVGSINWVLGQAKNQRNAIVIMSDGVDNSLPGVPGKGSKTSFNELLDRIQESDTIIFPIYLNTEQEVIEELGLFIPQAYAISRQQLQTLADTTGGSIFYANHLSDLSGCYERVASELRTIYSLGYYPTNGNNDGGFRKIRLRVKRDDVKVKTRRGYYAKNA